jgi:hypothetical protein
MTTQHLINELNRINMTPKTIDNQNSAHEAVRNKRYIVGSYQPGVGLSFSAVPVLHNYRADARTECRRLAKLNPGKTYLFVCLEGAEMTVAQPQTVSI